MADPLISVLIENLVSIVEQRVTKEINLVSGVREEVEKLSILMKAIQGVLNDAENRRVENRVKLWLEQFEELFYDMDNMFDEWHTAVLNKQIKKKVHFPFSSPSSFLKQVRNRRGIALEIKKLNERLEFIDKSRIKLDLLPIVSVSDFELFKPVESIALIDKSEIIGRHSDKGSLVNKLLVDHTPNSKSFEVISIVGTGGLGKTTLAQLAFNDDQINNIFDRKIWVCVSDPFHLSQVAKTILESLIGSVPNSSSLNSLLTQIKENLCGKRILLVLDDVWPHDRNNWDQLRVCLQDVASGSKILVTTRDQRVAVSMGTNHFQKFNTLSEEECWSLVSKIAFGQKIIEESDREEFEVIGKKLANKCKGLPLAAKTIGSLLRLKHSVSEWNNILVSKLWELEDVKVELFSHLFLSYSHLPLVLRHCFKICSIFPKDFKIQPKKLIKIWMSLGYISSNKNGDDMEEKGYEYIHNLVMCSFFQDVVRSKVNGKIKLFKIHDIVHDFAQFLMENECFMAESGNNNRRGKFTCRHLTIVDSLESTTFSDIIGMEKLRTLFIDQAFIPNVEYLSDFFQHLKYIRCLNLSRCDLRELPKEIKLLIHLRYLDLSWNLMLSKLPKGICDLCNLETLDLTECWSLRTLPGAIGKLISLRHLLLKNTTDLRQLPKGILKLARLWTLNRFIVGGGKLKLEDLKYFNHLQGDISIDYYDFEEEDIDVDAVDVFQNKDKITRLSLDYVGGYVGDIRFLTRLKWTPNVIKIAHFTFPHHGTNFGPLLSTFRNVRRLLIHFCTCYRLPPLGKLQFLEMLEIHRAYNLKYVGDEVWGIEMESANNEGSPLIAFPKLKSLDFDECYPLTNWIGLSDRQRDEYLVMPSLVDLKVRSCPKFDDLPHGLLNMLPQLRDVNIADSTELVRRYREGEWDEHLWISRVTVNATTELY